MLLILNLIVKKRVNNKETKKKIKIRLSFKSIVIILRIQNMRKIHKS